MTKGNDVLPSRSVSSTRRQPPPRCLLNANVCVDVHAFDCAHCSLFLQPPDPLQHLFWGEIEMDCVAQYFIIINYTECCYSDTRDNYFTTDFFLYALLSLSLLLPSSKPFRSCSELVLHKLPSGILNQSPATKGESVWLITEQCAQHACGQTHTEREGEGPLSEELTLLQKTW